MSNLGVKILLITLIHNRKHLVGRALQSAVNQTLSTKHWNHLVWDNASIDKANHVAGVFCSKYSHMNFVQCDSNLGQQRAYNKILLEHVNDETVICILDSDDELYPNALYEVKRTFEANPEIGGAYSGFSLLNSKGGVIVADHGKAKLIKNQFTQEGQRLLRKTFLGANPCGHLRSYSVKCLREIGGFNSDYEYATDYNIFGRLLEKYIVIKIPKVLYKFYQHGSQVQAQHSPQQTKDWKDMQAEFRDRWTKTGLV